VCFKFTFIRFDPFQYFVGLKEIPSPTAGRITEGSLASSTLLSSLLFLFLSSSPHLFAFNSHDIDGFVCAGYAEFLNVLGLCSRDDVALVRGTVEAGRNLKILQNLSKMAKASLVVNQKKQSCVVSAKLNI
jgi:hypothetical protein